MRKLIIGLFCPVNQDLTPYINRLQGLGEVRLIMVRQENLGPIDLLVYPDGMGILPDTPGLIHGKRVFTPSKPINPYFYLFWNERPFQTIVEERDIPIIGIGDAAAMLYSEIGGKLIVNTDGEVTLLTSKTSEIETIDDDYIVRKFSYQKVYGATDWPSFTEVLKQAIEDISTKETIEDIESDNKDEDDGIEEPPNNTPKRPIIPGRI